MTALVSFDRVFEVLDLQAADRGAAGAVAAARQRRRRPGQRPAIDFDHVSFRYPAAERGVAGLAGVDRAAGARAPGPAQPVLRDVTLHAPRRAADRPGRAVRRGQDHDHPPGVPALRPGRGRGAHRRPGPARRDPGLAARRGRRGHPGRAPVPRHDPGQPAATPGPRPPRRSWSRRCQAAQIWDLIAALPDGLDTVVGDRGYRLSGGEKQRLAIARLLLKAPSRGGARRGDRAPGLRVRGRRAAALKTALAGRTSLVIAHRLSTIREADQILVIDDGPGPRARARTRSCSRAGGLYAELYHTQFAGQEPRPRRSRDPGLRGSRLPRRPGPDPRLPPPGPSGAVAHPAEFLTRDRLDLAGLGQASAGGATSPARRRPSGPARRAPACAPAWTGSPRWLAAASAGWRITSSYRKRDHLAGGQLAAQPRHLAHRAPPAHRAPGRHGQAGPGGPVGLGLQAQQRARELGVDVHEPGPEPGQHPRISQHPGHRVPAVPDDLEDPRVTERVEQGLGAVHQVRAGIPVADDRLLADARPDAVERGRPRGTAGCSPGSSPR